MKKIAFLALGVIGIAPVAAVVACGSSGGGAAFSPVLTTDQAALVTSEGNAYADKVVLLRPTSGSTHDNVSWAKIPALPSSISSYFEPPEFSTDDSPSEQSEWSASLPTSFAPERWARRLTVRLAVKAGVTGLVPIVRSFDASALNEVKINVNALASFKTAAAFAFKISGTLAAPVFAEPVLGDGLSSVLDISYRIQNGQWMSQADLKAYFRSSGSSVTSYALDTIMVSFRFKSHADPLYVLTENEFKVDASGLTGWAATSGYASIAALSAGLAALKARSDSTTDAVHWGTLPALGTTLAGDYDSLQYSTLSYANEGVAVTSKSSGWTDTPPSTLPDKVAERHLWVRVMAKAGSQGASSWAQDMTVTSGILDVIVDGNNRWSAGKMNLATSVLDGSNQAPVVRHADYGTLADLFVFTYRFRGAWYSEADFLTALSSAAHVTRSDLDDILVRAQGAPGVLFTEQNLKLNVASTFGLSTFTDAEVSEQVHLVASKIALDIGSSKFSTLVWQPFVVSDVVSADFAADFRIEYNATGNFGDAAIAVASTTGWQTMTTQTDLPTANAPPGMTLWIRAVPLAGTEASAEAEMAVDPSAFDVLLVDLNTIPEWEAFSHAPQDFLLTYAVSSTGGQDVYYSVDVAKPLPSVPASLSGLVRLEVGLPAPGGQITWKEDSEWSSFFPASLLDINRWSESRVRWAPVPGVSRLEPNHVYVEIVPKFF